MFTIKAKLKQLNETEQSKAIQFLHYICNCTCCDKMTIAVDIKVVYMSCSLLLLAFGSHDLSQAEILLAKLSEFTK